MITSFNGTVTVGLGTYTNNYAGSVSLGGTLTVTASNGVATFSGLTLSNTTAGYFYSLYISGGGFGWAVTNTVLVTAGPAAQVAITAQPPSSVTAGTGFGLQAAIEDAYGNVVTTDNSDVVTAALATNPTGTTLGGTLSATVIQGVATFSGLTLTDAAAGYGLGVSSGSFSTTSDAITVTPAAATQVVITQEPPASVALNGGFGLQASVEDEYGNVVTSASSTVKVALANNPTGAKLGGTVSVKASKGVATFSGLTLNKVGTGYTLQVTSSGLSSSTTSAIAVTTTAADMVLSDPAPIAAPDPLLTSLVLDRSEFLDSLELKKGARWAGLDWPLARSRGGGCRPSPRSNRKSRWTAGMGLVGVGQSFRSDCGLESLTYVLLSSALRLSNSQLCRISDDV